MRFHTTLAEPIETQEPVVLAAGVFDGLHLGHQQLIGDAVQSAASSNGQSWVLTFDQHPLRILRPDAAPPRILSAAGQRSGLQQLGLHGSLVLPFTHDLAKWTAREFVDHLRHGFPTLQHIVVGPDWRFGHNAEGTVTVLRELGQLHGFTVHMIEPVLWNGDRVSSSRIRQALVAGRMQDATAMLGRTYQLNGTVIHGRKVGRELGYPTANLEPDNDIVPPSGIYATSVIVGNDTVLAAGYRAEGRSKVFEVYLIDHSTDLYGQTLTVNVHERLRDHIEFSSKTALLEQIAQDIDRIRVGWSSFTRT